MLADRIRLFPVTFVRKGALLPFVYGQILDYFLCLFFANGPKKLSMLLYSMRLILMTKRKHDWVSGSVHTPNTAH